MGIELQRWGVAVMVGDRQRERLGPTLPTMGTHLPWLGVVVAAAVVGACNPSATTTGVDAGAVPSNPCDPRLFAGLEDASRQGPGETYDYVINRMIVDEGAAPDTTTRAFYGFNLDGRFSPSRTAAQRAADCSHGDYFSTLDPDQNTGTCLVGSRGVGMDCLGGVDNQLPQAIETIFQLLGNRVTTGNALLDQQINTGRYTLLVRVAGVHGTLGASLNDQSVTIRVYPVAWPTFQGCGGIQQQQQTYAVDDRSLREAGNLNAPVLDFPGCIVGGRLRQSVVSATASATPMTLPLVDSIRIPAYDVQLRFDLEGGGGQNGNLGATTLASEVQEALSATVSDERYRSAVGMLVQSFIDVASPQADSGVSCESPHGLIRVGPVQTEDSWMRLLMPQMFR